MEAGSVYLVSSRLGIDCIVIKSINYTVEEDAVNDY